MSASASLWLIATGARHRRELAAPVAEEIARWRGLAATIGEPALREAALEKIEHEAGHASAATMLAAHAPRGQRVALAQTIVALELLYDHLDGRTEAAGLRGGAGSGLVARRELLGVFADACALRRPRVPEWAGDREYLRALACAARAGLASLPGALLVRERLAAAGARAAEAQARVHSIGELGSGQAEEWARGQADGSGLGWREQLAACGASVLCVHALALRAAPAGGAAPEQLDHAYLYLAALATLLDGLVDRDGIGAGAGYAGLYPDEVTLGEAAVRVGARAGELLGALGPRHQIMLSGLVAHFAAARGAGQDRTTARVLSELRRRNVVEATLASVALSRSRASRRANDPAPDLVLHAIQPGDEPAAG